MRHYLLDIELTSGENVIGKAITTQIKAKQEFIVIELKTESKEVFIEKKEIRLDLIKQITALDKSAEFKTVEIS